FRLAPVGPAKIDDNDSAKTAGTKPTPAANPTSAAKSADPAQGTTSATTQSRCRIMTPVECIARLVLRCPHRGIPDSFMTWFDRDPIAISADRAGSRVEVIARARRTR